MNLADMLSYADIKNLSTIAKAYNCDGSSHSKNELIQSILSIMNKREVVESSLNALAIEDIRFLNSLLFDPRDSFSLEELLARVQHTKYITNDQEPWNPREMIGKFKERGWIFNGYSQQTKYLFHVPADLKQRFTKVLAQQFKDRVTTSIEPVAYRDEQMIIIEDLTKFLHYVEAEEIPLTTEGSMYKRNLQHILDSFSVKEEFVAKGAWRFGYGRRFKEYPNRFSLIYDYCYFHGLIVEQNGTLLLTEKGSIHIRGRQTENLLPLYRFWLRLYKGPIPSLISIVYWIDQMAASWVKLDSIAKELCPLIRPYYYDTSETIVEERIVLMLLHLGVLRLGEDERNNKVLMMTKLGRGLIKGTYRSDEESIDTHTSYC